MSLTKDHPRACGEYLASFFYDRGPQDHPRACGEYTKQQFEIIVLLLHEHGEFI